MKNAWSITLNFHERDVDVDIAQIRAKFQKVAEFEGGWVDQEQTDEAQVCILIPTDESAKTIIIEYGKIPNTSIFLDYVELEEVSGEEATSENS